MTAMAPRARYLGDAISTASPAKLLIMLYDRLLLDLAHGEQALRDGEREHASAAIMHAQDIILELQCSLEPGGWPAARKLAAVYTFLLTELIGANVHADADRVAACKALVQPLADAWRQAALASLHEPGTTSVA